MISFQHQPYFMNVSQSFKQTEELPMVNFPTYPMELDEASLSSNEFEANCSTDTFLSSYSCDHKLTDNLSINGDISSSECYEREQDKENINNMKLPCNDKTYHNCNQKMNIDQEFQDKKLSKEEISALLGEDDVYNDFLNELFEQEKVTDYNSISWYDSELAKDKDFLYCRKYAIEWIRVTAKPLKLLSSTVFRANYYFDKLASVKRMNNKWLICVAAVCLWIACKFDEIDYNIPCLETILHFLPKEITRSNENLPFTLISSEIKILNALEFKLKTVLPIDFIQYYIYSENANQEGVLFEHDQIHHFHIHKSAKIKNDIESFAVFFLHLIGENYSFWKYPSSVIAMSVICAARRCMFVTPYFNPKLVKLCRYNASEIHLCFEELWNVYCHKFPNQASKHETRSLLDF